jgi:L-ascorbate metabolism protein UlaG (beta-lactamase superfamily)
MSVKMRWLGTACFEISLPGKQSIVIDPYVDDSVSAPITSGEFEGCDYIFITHGHYDHVLDAGKLVNQFNPKIFCSEVTASSLVEHQGVPPSLINRVIPGDVIKEKDLAVEVLHGVHVDFSSEYKRLTGRNLMEEGPDLKVVIKKAMVSMLGTDRIPEELGGWMAQYPQGDQLNFVFELSDGKRIYMAGTYPEPSVIKEARRAKADITLLQVLPGKTLHGIEEQIAHLAIASGCKIAVPQHHDPLLPGAIETDLSTLKRIFAEKTDIEFKELVPGEWYSF